MKHRIYPVLAGSGLLMMASTFSAQAQTKSETAEKPVATLELEEVIVTARRKEESAQDVPQALSVITGAALDKLNFVQFEDLSKVLPGVTLTTQGNVTTVRGVSFNPVAGTSPTVAMYVNDAPLNSAFVFQSMFDIGQVELLRGPQGTLRGQSAPSGAITITTRKPDLYNFGGSMSTTVTDLDARNLQGAINLPVLEGKLALRFAGLVDHTDNGGVESVNSTAKPYVDSTAIRVSARFDPTDFLSVVATYQNLQLKSATLGTPIYGNGAPGGNIPATITASSAYGASYIQTPGVNGPVIPTGKRLSVAENADLSKSRQQLATGQIDYAFAGQKLSYVGAWSSNVSPTNTTFGDTVNVLKGIDWQGRTLASTLTRRTNELRISSEEQMFGFMDYVAGVYDQNEDIANAVGNGYAFQPGAFGSPFNAPIAQAPNLRYTTTSLADIPTHYNETSYFATLTAHLWDKAELAGGIRYIDAKRTGDRTNNQTASYRAVRTLTGLTTCDATTATLGTTYANAYDVLCPATTTIIPNSWKKRNTVYSGSFSWHFTDDMMAYVSTGTSWRAGPAQGSLVNGRNDPFLASLVQLADEESTSYELGFKSTWLDKRLRLNIDVYHQKFDKLVFSSFTSAPYLEDTGTGADPTIRTPSPLNYNIDAKVKGVDVDTGFVVTDHWNVGLGYSWAKGKYASQKIPCQDGNFDGVPDTISPTVAGFQAARVFMAQCQSSGGPSATTPDWNATLQSEFHHAIASGVEGFASGLFTYYKRNANADPNRQIGGYGLLNVYLGVRNPDAGWELQVFAKNALDKEVFTSVGRNQNSGAPSVSGIFGNSGYFGIGYAPRQEYGASFRYGFGSR